jgi:hypothetical protein
MRTDKVIGKVLTKDEWADIIREHYSDAEQNKRVSETVDFVANYCLEVKGNGVARFRGLIGYLDCDDSHVELFKNVLYHRLSLEKIGDKIDIDLLDEELESGIKEREELVITWSM